MSWNSSAENCSVGAEFLNSALHTPLHVFALSMGLLLSLISVPALIRARRTQFRPARANAIESSACALLTSAFVGALLAGLGTIPVQTFTSGIVFPGPCGQRTLVVSCVAALTPATLGLSVFLMAFSLLAIERFYIIQLIAKANGMSVPFWISWVESAGRKLGLSSGVLVFITWLWGFLVCLNSYLIFDVSQPFATLQVCSMPKYKPTEFLPGMIIKNLVELGAVYAISEALLDGFSFRQSQISLEARLRLRHTVVLCHILRPAFLWQTGMGVAVTLPGFLVVFLAWQQSNEAATALAFYMTINGAQILPMLVGVAISLHRLATLDEKVNDDMALRSQPSGEPKPKPKKRHFVPLEHRVEPTTAGTGSRAGLESEFAVRFAALHEQWGRAPVALPPTPNIEITTV